MVVDSTFCRISYAGGTGIVGHGRKNIDASIRTESPNESFAHQDSRWTAAWGCL